MNCSLLQWKTSLFLDKGTIKKDTSQLTLIECDGCQAWIGHNWNGTKFKTEKLWYILLPEDKYYLEYYKYCTVSKLAFISEVPSPRFLTPRGWGSTDRPYKEHYPDGRSRRSTCRPKSTLSHLNNLSYHHFPGLIWQCTRYISMRFSPVAQFFQSSIWRFSNF